MVAQTTFNREIFVNCTNLLKNTCKSIGIFDTICNATDERQREARILAAESDAVIVIGDKTSSNSRRLYEICCQVCRDTVFVENAQAARLRALPRKAGGLYRRRRFDTRSDN